MHRALEQLPAYLIVMTISMAGLKLVGHTPELPWLAVFAPAMLLPALVVTVAVSFGLALVVSGACSCFRTLFTRTTTTPKE